MKQFKRLAHAVWRCKYHIVWCPKYRFRILKGEVGESIRDMIKQLCEWKKIEILEDAMFKVPGCTKGNSPYAPLKHEFGDGIYIRTIFMKKNTLLTTRVHKFRHPYFIMKGDNNPTSDPGKVRFSQMNRVLIAIIY